MFWIQVHQHGGAREREAGRAIYQRKKYNDSRQFDAFLKPQGAYFVFGIGRAASACCYKTKLLCPEQGCVSIRADGGGVLKKMT